jgi:hypothetical protein
MTIKQALKEYVDPFYLLLKRGDWMFSYIRNLKLDAIFIVKREIKSNSTIDNIWYNASLLYDGHELPYKQWNGMEEKDCILLIENILKDYLEP